MTLEQAPDVLTSREVQQITRLGRDKTQKLFHQVLPNIGTTKRFLTPKSALVRWLESGGQT
jgi:hypothetical protein